MLDINVSAFVFSICAKVDVIDDIFVNIKRSLTVPKLHPMNDIVACLLPCLSML